MPPADSPEIEVAVEVEPSAEAEPATTAEVDAARAAASADTAREAAALAIAQSEAAVADAVAIAAGSIENYQARLEQCEASLSVIPSLAESYEASQARLTAIEEQQALILSRLEQNPQPRHASPEGSPPSETGEGDHREAGSEAEAEASPPAEPSPPERRRAHRWI